MTKAYILIKTNGRKRVVTLRWREDGVKSEVTSGEFTGLHARDGAYAIEYHEVAGVIAMMMRINRPLRKNRKVEESDIRDLESMLLACKRS